MDDEYGLYFFDKMRDMIDISVMSVDTQVPIYGIFFINKNLTRMEMNKSACGLDSTHSIHVITQIG